MSFERNYKIERLIRAWKTKSGCERPIQYWYSQGILTICSSEVGKLVGPMGSLVEKYRGLLKEQHADFVDVRFQEVNYHYI